MSRFRLIGILAIVFVALAADFAAATSRSDVTVIVENLRSADGEVRIALWSNPAEFTNPDAAIAETGQKAEFGRVTFTFPGLAPGRYAIASFHDENGNGTFDRGFLGLPKEGLGFSNDAWINLGPPTFDAAAVEITRENQVVVVKLRY